MIWKQKILSLRGGLRLTVILVFSVSAHINHRNHSNAENQRYARASQTDEQRVTRNEWNRKQQYRNVVFMR